MKILVCGVENMVGELLIEQLKLQQHEVTAVIEDVALFEKYKTQEILAIQGNLQENGLWMKYIPQELDYIINCSYPKVPEHLSLGKIENEYAQQMLRIGQNLIYIATSKKVKRIFQMGNIFYYSSAGDTHVSEKTPRDLAPENYGAIFNGVIGQLTAQKDVPYTLALAGQFIYDSSGKIFPSVPMLMHSTFIMPGTESQYLQLTHIEDYVGAIVHLLSTEANLPIINIVDNTAVQQNQFFGIIGSIHKLQHAISMPSAIASIICGDAYVKSLEKTITSKNDLLKSTGYWLKYPDYKAGFAKYIMNF